MSAAGNSRFEPGLALATITAVLMAAIWVARDGTAADTHDTVHLWVVALASSGVLVVLLLSLRRLSIQSGVVRTVEKNEASLRELADALPQLVWTARPDGTRDYLNQRWFDYAGLAPVVGDPPDWKRAVYPGDIEAFEQAWRLALESGEAFDSEYRLLRARDNSYRWHIVRAEPILDANQNITRWVGTSTDIEEQKRAEHLLNILNLDLKEDVRDRIRQLEAFSYSVSHDLRAPLRAISGFAEILVKRHSAKLNAQGRHYLENIVDASRQMGELIDDLLDYARMGRKAITIVPVNLQTILNEVLLSFQSKVAELEAAIEVPEPLPVVLGDRTLLTQIFTNLLDNALIYRRPNVPPAISVTWASSQDGVTIFVRVSDNGIGIAKENFERIFNVFERLHGDDEYPGTGIGLAVVRRALDLIGGAISVESRAGSGTTFHVRLAIRASDTGVDPRLAPVAGST